MNKILRLYICCILFLFSAVFSSYADKFGTTFSTDYITQDSNQNFKNLPAQSPSIPKTQPIQKTNINTLEISAINNPTISMSEGPQLISPIPSVSLPSSTGLRQINIKIPDYEKKLNQMMQATEEKAKKKKKSLVDSILEEIVRYGMPLVLILVLLVIFYALRKDKTSPQPIATEKPENTEETKKTIWDDEF